MVDVMQVCVTHSTASNPNQHFARSRTGGRDLLDRQGATRSMKDCGFHVILQLGVCAPCVDHFELAKEYTGCTLALALFKVIYTRRTDA